jgi:hypothetical protein
MALYKTSPALAAKLHTTLVAAALTTMITPPASSATRNQSSQSGQAESQSVAPQERSKASTEASSSTQQVLSCERSKGDGVQPCVVLVASQQTGARYRRLSALLRRL